MENLEKGELFSDEAIIGNARIKENEYRKIGKFCDFTLKLKNTGASLSGHKVVLSSTCPFFRALFDSEMIECTKGYLEFDDFITKDELNKIIKYLYTGKLHIPITSAEKYYEHADFFQLESLRDFCTKLLIQNIQSDTCLYSWRFAVKFSNENLKTTALEYILRNSEQLFESEIFLDLTIDEVKEVISSDKIKCSEENIYTFVMKWLNSDLKNRSINIEKLIEDVRFPLISDSFLKSEVLNNNFLIENQEFHITIRKILESKLNENISSEGEISSLKFNKFDSPRVGFRQENLMAIFDQKIYKFDKNILTNTLLLNSQIALSEPRITNFATNYLLISDGQNSKKCWYYCPERNAIKSFPSMIEGRSMHGVTTLHDKIYSCGGVNSVGSVEVFDLGAGVWEKGTSLKSERSNFGITTWDNCIYVMGGSKKYNAERYDPREDRWSLFPSIPALKDADLTRSIAFNNSVFGFTSSGGFVFDVRAHKWMETKVSPPSHWEFFDLTKIVNKVYAIGRHNKQCDSCSGMSSGTSFCTYDLINNIWLQEQRNSLKCINLSVFTMFT